MSDSDLRRMPPSPNGPGNTTFRMVAGIPTAQPTAAGPSATPMFTLRCRGLPKLIEIRRVLHPHRRGQFLDLSDLIGRKTFAVLQPNADQILEGRTELVIADLFLGEFDVLLRPGGREVLERESESSGQAVRTVSGLARLSAVQSQSDRQRPGRRTGRRIHRDPCCRHRSRWSSARSAACVSRYRAERRPVHAARGASPRRNRR
jgi:hypothetical protein